MKKIPEVTLEVSFSAIRVLRVVIDFQRKDFAILYGFGNLDKNGIYQQKGT